VSLSLIVPGQCVAESLIFITASVVTSLVTDRYVANSYAKSTVVEQTVWRRKFQRFLSYSKSNGRKILRSHRRQNFCVSWIGFILSTVPPALALKTKRISPLTSKPHVSKVRKEDTSKQLLHGRVLYLISFTSAFTRWNAVPVCMALSFVRILHRLICEFASIQIQQGKIFLRKIYYSFKLYWELNSTSSKNFNY